MGARIGLPAGHKCNLLMYSLSTCRCRSENGSVKPHTEVHPRLPTRVCHMAVPEPSMLPLRAPSAVTKAQAGGKETVPSYHPFLPKSVASRPASHTHPTSLFSPNRHQMYVQYFTRPDPSQPKQDRGLYLQELAVQPTNDPMLRCVKESRRKRRRKCVGRLYLTWLVGRELVSRMPMPASLPSSLQVPSCRTTR